MVNPGLANSAFDPGWSIKMQALRNIPQADHGRRRLALGVSLALHAIVLVAVQVLVFPKSPQFGLFSGVHRPETIPPPPIELDLSAPAVLEPVVATVSETAPAPEPSPAAEPDPAPNPEPLTEASLPSLSGAAAPAPPNPTEPEGNTPLPPPSDPVLTDAIPTLTRRPTPQVSPVPPLETAPLTMVEIAPPPAASNQAVVAAVAGPAPTASVAAPAVTQVAMWPTTPGIAEPTTRPSQKFTEARYAYKPAPIYPPSARQLQLEGSVVLDVQIDADGTVRSAKVRTGSGHRILDQAALSGIRRWRFEPARRGAVPVPSSAVVPIEFRLE